MKFHHPDLKEILHSNVLMVIAIVIVMVIHVMVMMEMMIEMMEMIKMMELTILSGSRPPASASEAE